MQTSAETKHTEGPWRIEPAGIDGVFNIETQELRYFAKYSGSVRGADLATHLANARLIAAAPDLLEALRRADHTLSLHGKIDADTDLHEFIRAAIAKARP